MSNFDWNKSASEEGQNAEKIPAGEGIPVKISKIVYGKKGGGSFHSRNGDPQIMLIFADQSGCEAALMVTLSEKAAWVLARIMSRFGLDLDALKAEGVQPGHFAEPTFANSRLVGLQGRINLKWKEDGYPDIEPCESPAVTPSAAPAPGELPHIDEASIPF